MQFAIPPTEIEYADFMQPFELLFRDIKSEKYAKNMSMDIKLGKAQLSKMIQSGGFLCNMLVILG